MERSHGSSIANVVAGVQRAGDVSSERKRGFVALIGDVVEEGMVLD